MTFWPSPSYKHQTFGWDTHINRGNGKSTDDLPIFFKPFLGGVPLPRLITLGVSWGSGYNVDIDMALHIDSMLSAVESQMVVKEPVASSPPVRLGDSH